MPSTSSKLVTIVVPTSVVDPVDDDQITVFVAVDPPSVTGGCRVVFVFFDFLVVTSTGVVVGSNVVVSCRNSSVVVISGCSVPFPPLSWVCSSSSVDEAGTKVVTIVV